MSKFTIHSFSLEARVFQELLKLNDKINGNFSRTTQRLIKMKDIRIKVCPLFNLEKDDVDSILDFLAQMNSVRIVPKHGIEVNTWKR